MSVVQSARDAAMPEAHTYVCTQRLRHVPFCRHAFLRQIFCREPIYLHARQSDALRAAHIVTPIRRKMTNIEIQASARYLRLLALANRTREGRALFTAVRYARGAYEGAAAGSGVVCRNGREYQERATAVAAREYGRERRFARADATESPPDMSTGVDSHVGNAGKQKQSRDRRVRCPMSAVL